VRLYLGEITEAQFLNEIATKSESNDQLAERLTEGYFYLAKVYQQQGDFSAAVMLYKLALAGNVYEFVEHRFSLLEISRIMTAYEAQNGQKETN
jgi:lipoprotein NlpI